MKRIYGHNRKGAKDPGSKYSFREGCWRRPFAFIRWEKCKKKSENCWETNYTGKLKTGDSFLKSRPQFRFLKRKRKKGRDALCTKHKDKLYFKMFKSCRNKRGNEK